MTPGSSSKTHSSPGTTAAAAPSFLLNSRLPETACVYAIKAEEHYIRIWTDGGTDLLRHRFKDAVTNLMPFKHVIPTHQGRAAEAILMSILGGPGRMIPSNTHFDTTRGNIEATGAQAFDLVVAEGRDPTSLHPFKGNMDLETLEAFLTEHGDAVPVVMLTITNNAGGGQPVSLANIRATAGLARRFGKPFIIDGCRFAENAWFIKQREDGQADRSIPDIVRDCFASADGMTMSGKKDAFGNIGGWLALNDDAFAEQARVRLIQTEGFPTYGGLAGRDLEALAQGLEEIVDENYLLPGHVSIARLLGQYASKRGSGHRADLDVSRNPDYQRIHRWLRLQSYARLDHGQSRGSGRPQQGEDRNRCRIDLRALA